MPVLLGKSYPSAAGSVPGRPWVTEAARGCRQPVALGTRGDTRGTREVAEVRGQFGAFPTSHLPASQPHVAKGLIQPKPAQGRVYAVPVGVEHLSTPYHAL